MDWQSSVVGASESLARSPGPPLGWHSLWRAWDGEASSCSSPSRCDNMVSFCGQLPVPRENYQELAALDEPALGGFPRQWLSGTSLVFPGEGAIYHSPGSAQINSSLIISCHCPKQSLSIKSPFLLKDVKLTSLHKKQCKFFRLNLESLHDRREK